MDDKVKNPAHIIASLLVKRKYKSKGISLQDGFWNIPKYKKEYQHQIRGCYKYLSVYDYSIILSTLKDNPNIFSLYFPKMADMLEEKKSSLELQKSLSENKEIEETPLDQSVINPKINFRKQKKESLHG